MFAGVIQQAQDEITVDQGGPKSREGPFKESTRIRGEAGEPGRDASTSQGLPAAPEAEEVGRVLHRTLSSELGPVGTLISDFWPPEP